MTYVKTEGSGALLALNPFSLGRLGVGNDLAVGALKEKKRMYLSDHHSKWKQRTTDVRPNFLNHEKKSELEMIGRGNRASCEFSLHRTQLQQLQQSQQLRQLQQLQHPLCVVPGQHLRCG